MKVTVCYQETYGIKEEDEGSYNLDLVLGL